MYQKFNSIIYSNYLNRHGELFFHLNGEMNDVGVCCRFRLHEENPNVMCMIIYNSQKIFVTKHGSSGARTQISICKRAKGAVV